MQPFLFGTSILIISLTSEIIYSVYKNDQKYQPVRMFNNFLRGTVLIILSANLVYLFSVFFTDLYNALHKVSQPITLISFFVCLLITDFMYYIFHRLHHSVPFLRNLHIVHHSDKQFNLSTAFRISWLEQSYIFLFLTPSILIGFSPKLVFFTALFLVIYQLYCHSSYLNLPSFLNYFLVTANTHRNHHDEREENQNSNYGAIFTIWDKMFRTFTKPKLHLVFGIKGYQEDNFIKMETSPILNFFKKYYAKN